MMIPAAKEVSGTYRRSDLATSSSQTPKQYVLRYAEYLQRIIFKSHDNDRMLYEQN